MTTVASSMSAPARTAGTSNASKMLRRALGLARTRLGLVLSGTVILLVVIGPFLAPYDPNKMIGTPGSSPGNGMLFGADILGRDVFSRFLNGGANILSISALATLLALAVGIATGMLAGAGSTRIGGGVSWVTDLILSFPQIVLPLLFIARFGPEPWLLVLIVALNQFPQTTRIIKSVTAEVYERDFIKVAQAIGLPRRRIIWREVLPNILAPIFVEGAFRFTYSIALVASLSFIGFGAQPPDADWGRMVYENKGFFSLQPWGVLMPMFAILVLTLGTHLVADGFGRALGKRGSPAH